MKQYQSRSPYAIDSFADVNLTLPGKSLRHTTSRRPKGRHFIPWELESVSLWSDFSGREICSPHHQTSLGPQGAIVWEAKPVLFPYLTTDSPCRSGCTSGFVAPAD